MSLTPKFSDWGAVINDNPSVLNSKESAQIVSAILSKSVRRGPQKLLCSAVLPHVATILDQPNGCLILGSLINYGTSRTVKLITKAISDSIKDTMFKSSMPLELSNLVRFIARRVDCVQETEEFIKRVKTPILALFPEAPETTVKIISGLITNDPSIAYGPTLKKKLVALGKGKDLKTLNTFVKLSMEDATYAERGQEVASSLWKSVATCPLSTGALESLANAGGADVADEICKIFLKKSGQESDDLCTALVKHCSEEVSRGLIDHIMKNTKKVPPSAWAAAQLRFFDLASKPEISAAAEQWCRARIPKDVRTRQLIRAKIAAKRVRSEDDDEF
eukprot:Tbor_TRINITY_DN3870_c1_g1::TRINITY_DN3870_c1_g1_i1::g.5690::m.5690